MRKIFALLIAVGMSFGPALAQEIPPLSLFKRMMGPSGTSGWVGFREFMGRQVIYFSGILSYHCHIEEIGYSINSSDLDKRFLVPPCDPASPYADPEHYKAEDITVMLPSRAAKSVHMQVLFDDGSESKIFEFTPCPDAVGAQTCALLVE